MTNHDPVGLYVPRPDTSSVVIIDAGSGVVGTPAGPWLGSEGAEHLGLLVVDYEGARYAHNLVTYFDRVQVAAGRHLARYPTVARSFHPEGDFQHVGWYYPQYRKIDVPGPNELMALTGWLTVDGEGPNLHVEVRPSSTVIV